ncbi:purine phosphorylase [Rhizoclosmatium globosum]|uniref:S-methyl-5'-thioadenosine phosphorylase n=1 Tax=Rhizoclosmatium globosum TaxID=329046 RepID=A0A1Y2BQJ3_9FUNG|nr:purine phosphorylase [Rhizoclosmatium globosum]|eukprot:ORY37022.1 purine phosphorylase [Rhizoclosmatium globosum]
MSTFTDVKVAVIGGSGLYHLEGLKVLGEVNPETPWGFPSDKIVVSETAHGTKVAFLARHGRGHYLNPSEVPARANIAALKHLGVEVILAFSAVGSLQEEIAPRDFVIPSQVVDRTKGVRPSTFFENGVVAHAMFADPFDTSLAALIADVAKTACPSVKFHTDKTLVCMEGPQFSTRAESKLYQSKLAREAEIAYQMVCMSTDYDCWREGEEAVNVEAVIANLGANSANAKNLLGHLIQKVEIALEQGTLKTVKELKGSMKFAGITDPAKRNKETVAKLHYILPNYF